MFLTMKSADMRFNRVLSEYLSNTFCNSMALSPANSIWAVKSLHDKLMNNISKTMMEWIIWWDFCNMMKIAFVVRLIIDPMEHWCRKSSYSRIWRNWSFV